LLRLKASRRTVETVYVDKPHISRDQNNAPFYPAIEMGCKLSPELKH